MPRRTLTALVLASLALAPLSARAGDEAAAAPTPGASVRVAADSYLRMFQRSPLPGPNGALVAQNFAAPLYEYATLQVDRIDLPWEPASLDVELSAWGDVNLGEDDGRLRVDGDILAASILHRLGWTYLKLGRQLQAGGAARLVRFDGLTAGVRTPWGLGAAAYGGWTVLPRWNQRPGYHWLGSAVDTDLRHPESLAEPSREGTWLGGGRLAYGYASYVDVGLSFHEQRENGELGRRDLGADVRVTPHRAANLTGKLLLDTDGWGFTDARGAADFYPVDDLSFAIEYGHAVPSLFLSRQSVLAVFSLDDYHEAGGSATWRPLEMWKLGASGDAVVFQGGALGARIKADSSLDLARWAPIVLRAEYGWMREPANGYHSGRLSLVYRPIEPLAWTAESYLYLYDTAINGVPFSLVGALTGEWAITDGWAALASGSAARTPLSSLDLQALARLRIDLEWEQL